MTSDSNESRTLRDIELEVLEEGREWMRRRLEQKLQEEVNRQGGVFPPQSTKSSSPTKAVAQPAGGRRSREAGGLARTRSRR
jgi:hypothetical protein